MCPAAEVGPLTRPPLEEVVSASIRKETQRRIMAQRKQLPDILLKVLGSAVLAGIVGIVAFVWAVYSSHSSDAVMKKQLENQATQLAKLVLSQLLKDG